MDEQRTSILVAGAINTDLVARVRRAPNAGETVTGTAFDIFGGGKGANQAFAAARFGARTAMLGALGRDDFGRRRLADLVAEGIETAHVAIVDGAASGVALIVVEESGQNRIAYVPGATATIDGRQAAASCGALGPSVVLSTIELPPDALRALFSEAKAQGAMLVVNATPEPAAGRELIASADVLIVNETEARELLAIEAENLDWSDVARRLTALGPANVCITLGAAGAIMFTDGVIATIAAPLVEVVDTTGAGDAFCGAMAAALTEGAPFVDAARRGVAAGTLAVTKAGAQPSMPRRADVLAMVAKMNAEEGRVG